MGHMQNQDQRFRLDAAGLRESLNIHDEPWCTTLPGAII